jgi:hypothetical protein
MKIPRFRQNFLQVSSSYKKILILFGKHTIGQINKHLIFCYKMIMLDGLTLYFKNLVSLYANIIDSLLIEN